MYVRAIRGVALVGLVLGQVASGQSPPTVAASPVNSGPFAGTIPDVKPDAAALRELASRAKLQAIEELKRLGVAADRIDKLAALTPTKFIERLALQPPVGPSTIAAPKPGASVPSPSVNWVGEAGGATTAHPGVALLLARREGHATFDAYCSGTLIRQNIILSATHCVCFSPEQGANYPTGTLCLKGDQDNAPAALLNPRRWRAFFQHAGLRELKRVEINESYVLGGTAVRGDIALFVLSRPVVEINPPALPPASDAAQTWASGLVVGFGLSANPNAPSAALLQQLVMPGLKAQGQVTSAPCTGVNYLDPKTTLCSIYVPLGGPGSKATVCKGDSGGPLWQKDASDLEIGVTSGRSDENCTTNNTVAFQMSTSYRGHWDWIDAKLKEYSSPPVRGRWPTFGENLRNVLDRRNAQFFTDQGRFESEGWMNTEESDLVPVLATINSAGPVTAFQLQDRAGHTLCKGLAGVAQKMPSVDYCWAPISPDTEFHIIAQGTPNQFLQYVVTKHAPNTSFAP